jgi:hypothetical protein
MASSPDLSRPPQCPIIGMARTSPAMTKWDCREFCSCYNFPRLKSLVGWAQARSCAPCLFPPLSEGGRGGARVGRVHFAHAPAEILLEGSIS